MTDNGKYEGLMDDKLDALKNQLGSRISSKLIPTNPNDNTSTLVDAFNIDWEGYKLGDNEFKYTNDLLTYISTELNSKSTSSGEVWDDIKDSAYITTQINIYTSSSSKSDVPNIAWQNQIATSYDNMTSYSTLPADWVTSIPNIAGNDEYVWMSAIYKVTSLANMTLGFHGPSSTPIYLSSESGIQGNFKSTVFTRTNSTPASPKQGANYNSGLPIDTTVYDGEGVAITYNSGNETCHWCDGIPASNSKEIIWASSAIITDSTPDETIWTTPSPMSDTDTYDVEFSASTDIVPTNTDWDPDHATAIWVDPGTRKYRNGTNYNGDFSEMRWRAEREMQNGSPLGPWVITKIVGEQGTAGVKGDFKSTVFTRTNKNISSLVISEVETNEYNNYNNPIPPAQEYDGETIVWSDGIPNGTGPVWSTWRTFSVDGNNSSWTTPTLVADTPTYDVEFSPYSNNNNTGPKTTTNIDTSDDWFDPTTDITLPTDLTWEDMIWRAERNRATSQDTWSEWVITKIKGEDGHVDLDVPYYEQRWMTFESTASVPDSWNNDNLPSKDSSYINIDSSNGWTLIPNYSSGGIVYMTSCKVIIDVIDNVQTKGYIGDWSTPIRVTGIDGKANPIQPVLKYQWYNTNEYSNAPSCSINSENPGNNWLESPGNPSGENKYLWMVQGQRQDNSMQTIDGTNYWTSPVCLSGADGEPGVDGDDIEFIYHRYDTVPVFGDNNNNPNHWAASSQDNYLGPTGYEWNDNPTGVTLSNKYEYCSYRRKTGNPKAWTKFSTPFPWSIYGENGIDGDGVEYIYAVTQTDTTPNAPQITNDNYEASQQSEWGVDENINGVIWHDDPQQLNNENQKYQWVSVRKYRYPKQNETLGGNVLDPNKKYWFDYSTPQLWNWYVNDGTNADRIVMLYKRTNSNTDCGDLPGHSEKMLYTVGTNGWAESPGNNTSANNDDYLWMISNYYSKKEIQRTGTIIYTITGEWSTPVCLTGEPGHEGEDGSDIEFIYYRTADDNKVPTIPDSENFEDGQYNESDWPFVNLKETHEDIDGSSVYDSAITKDGIKYLIDDSNYNILEDETISSLDNFENITSDMLHDVWTDNPLGVTSIYDYEYASIRKKIKGTWGDFCKPFLWSKYGEDGVDGDGVEYIYYLSSDENEVTFDASLETGNNNNTSNNPANWEISQDPEYRANNRWTDDPSGVSINNRWEYVSVRHKRFDAESNTTKWGKYSEPSLWAHFAVNGLATNLVLESDNDNITVGVTSEGTINNNYSDSVNFTLVFNTKPLDLDTDYTLKILTEPIPSAESNYNPFGTKTDTTIPFNNDLFQGNFASLTNNTLTVNIPEGFDMSQYDYIMSITLEAKIIRNDIDGLEIDTPAIFTLKISGVELSINDIYKLNIDKQVIKLDPNNQNYDTINISLKSLTSVNSITSNTEATNKHLYIRYNVSEKNNIDPDGNLISINNDYIPIGDYIPDKHYNKHTFRLYYILDDSFFNDPRFNNKLTDNVLNSHDAVLLDTETISAVWDGANGNPGTDSKAQEYIYFVTDDISYFESGNHANINPNNWDTHENVSINGVSYYAYLTDDFPFVNEQTSYLGWEDTHIGISEEHPYQFMSTREYNTTTKEWGKFSVPTCSHNWGHSGEDGDGVEYIYYLNDSAAFNGDKPQTWYNDTNYQNSEYIKTNTNWTDNPSNVGPNNKYEWVSIRKYKKIKYNDDILHLLFDDMLFDNISDEYNIFIENTDWDIQNPDITLLDYIYSICEYQVIGNSTIVSSVLNDYQSRWYDSQSGINLYEIIYNILNTYFNTLELEIKYDQGTESYTYFKLIEKENKFWTPYSEPSLWAKYGEKGATGDPGGSGLTFDFDNPSIQIAVNSNGMIKDYQEVTTYLNVYEGASKIPAKDITLSIISNGTHDAFEHSYSDTDKYGYTLFNSNNSNNGTSTYYTWKIGDVDTTNSGINTVGELKGNSNIEFNINYNNKDYVKRVSLVPIQYGKDGANAVVFDLYCPTSVIHYNAMDDTPSFNPTTISDIKVRRIENSNVEYFVASNDNEFTIKYKIDLYRNDVYDTTEEDEVDDGTLNINNIINTILSVPDKNYDIPKTVKLSLYHTESDTTALWDETDLEIIYDGINGTDSFAEEFIYSISYVPNDNDTSGGENPHDWAPNDSRDYIPNNQTSYWKDHPQGVSPEHQIEWMSHRTYNYETKTWNRYESPVKWSHYGENGKDGDGVEYIYWRPIGTAKETWAPNAIPMTPTTRDPRSWDTTTSDFQTSGYLGPTIGSTNSPWTDDPTGVTAENSYEYVSQRKYNGSTKSWGAFSMPAVWTHYGQKGDNGNPGADAYELDWDNDQINFGVNYDGTIAVGQNGLSKTAQLQIYTGDSNSGLSISSISVNNWNPGSHNNVTCSISKPQVTIALTANTTVTIPENGWNVTFNVNVSKNGNVIASGIRKTLKIFGQRTGQNGVSYEIVPSANAIYRNNSLYAPSQISYVVNKYDGTSVSKVSTFSDSFYAAWKPEGGGDSSSIGTSVLDISSTSSDIGISTISYINLELISNNVVIDRETIPIIDNGEKGAQGFTGAVVRMRGEWTANTKYGNGEYNSNYDGTSLLYKDIVIWNGNYITPKSSSKYITTINDNSGLCKGSSYVSSNAFSANDWIAATQYDFIATKLLYADQALINQISSHDFIATTQNGTPVAGMTSGKKEYGKNNERLTLLNNANNGDIDTGGLTGTSSDTLADTSHVRIFAGQIWNGNNSYSLTYAPFNVRQDGTAYMSKANIVGDVNIGGNVNISGDNVNMGGHLSANTLSLGRKSFYYNENVDLPAFSTDQHRVIYAMFYSTETFEIIPKSDSYLWLVRDDSENNGFYSTSHAGDSIQITDKALYTLYSGYGNNPIVSGNPAQKFWIITKNNLFVTHIETSGVTDYVPASISIDITDCIEINSVEFKKVGSSGNAWNSQVAFITFGFLKNQNVMPESETREYKINNVPTSFTFDKKESVNITLNLSENWTLVSQVNINQWGNVSQWGETLLWNNDNINNLTSHNKYKYVSKIPQNATDNIEGYPSFYIDKGTIEPEGGMCLEFYRNGTSNSNDFGANEFKNDLHIVSASLRLSRNN